VGGERTGAALARQGGHEGVQLRLEAHVQQPVRLVQHQHLRGRRRNARSRLGFTNELLSAGP